LGRSSKVIVVDTSALIAIVLEEDLAQACEDALVSADRRLIAAPTLTEAMIVARSKQRLDFLEDLIAGIRLEVIEWNETRARNAAAGYTKYGYGSKTNALNYGDSFSYALARVRLPPPLRRERLFADRRHLCPRLTAWLSKVNHRFAAALLGCGD
jgi:ribonuclease VapC